GAGSRYKGRPVGAGAELTAWSFHPRKVLTTGEGGMLTTSRPEWAARARRLREHSMSVSAADRHSELVSAPEVYEEVGFNYRMTDLQAAGGIVQLGKLPAMVKRRREIATAYAAAIATISGLRLLTDPAHGTCNFQSLWVEIGDEYPLTREELLLKLADGGISARRGIMAAHRQPPYAGGPSIRGPLPVTERLTERTLILPVYHQLSEEDQRSVIDVLLAPSAVPAHG
ncbi:MAG: DegT/DnrJ/EryC1/StrS family aminotransferase, partial [Cryobacterium sp.]|nr:DegT/DnrJ/EryC1/StrS family aminotransferase [Cryobacterium sp.]